MYTRLLLCAILLSIGFSCWAQPGSQANPVQLSGPRFGFTLITGEAAETMREEYDLSPFITQFGWHAETRFFSVPNGPTGVAEFIILLGGMEQSVVLPSLSGIVGIRGPTGLEIGFGPNLSLSGIAYAIGAGMTQSYGQLNIPINASIVLSESGPRVSLLVGFNTAVVSP